MAYHSDRKWRTPEGDILVEGESSATDFGGEPLHGVAEAHSYELLNSGGKVMRQFLPEQVRLDEYKERFHLIRYQVVGGELVRFTSYCYEESTYDIPFAQEKSRTTVLDGLTKL